LASDWPNIASVDQSVARRTNLNLGIHLAGQRITDESALGY